MALASIYRVVQDVQGNIVTEVLGTITQSGTSTLAALFSDAAGANPLPNPLVNNPAFGSYNVFVAAGSYDMSFLKVGYTFETQRNIVLRDPASGVNTLTGTANQVIVTPASGIGAVTLSLPQDIAPDSAVQFGRLGLATPADATAKLIVNGMTSLGGHAPTGVLDVQSSVVASDVPTQYYGVRVWPVAPSGASLVEALRVDAATGAGLAGAGIIGLAIIDQPAGIPGAQGLALNITAGGGRYNVYASGTAHNYFAGNVGIANTAPAYPLDVAGNVRVMGLFGIGTIPNSTQQISISYNRAAQQGVAISPSADTGPGSAVLFTNAAFGVVGSIQTNATATVYGTSSDVRLKSAVQALGNALSTIQALRPVSFKWKVDDSDGHGFLGHELQQVVPEAVSGEIDAVNDDGSVRPLQVDYSKLVVWLVGAVQELAARLDAAGV